MSSSERWPAPLPPLDDRLALLRRTAESLRKAAPAWVRSGSEAKGLPPDHAEEWLVGPVPVLRHVRLLTGSLDRIQNGRPTIDPSSVKGDEAEGPLRVRILPFDARDRLLFRGFSAEARMQRGVDAGELLARGGAVHRRRTPRGPALILGAGNVSSIPAMDALTQIFGEGRAAMVKTSPVNAWVGPHLEAGFAPLVEAGLLAVVDGDAQRGAELVADERFEHVHLTGSIRTHDRIVWGENEEERARRKAEDRPLLQKSLSSELGNVSPMAVVPGYYGARELDFVVETIAASVTNNAGFNCNATRLLIVAAGWHQKNALFERLRLRLERIPMRKAYYPGAEAAWASAIEGRETVLQLGARSEGVLPWTLLFGLSAEDSEPFFEREHFCPVLGVVELDVPGSLSFIEASTRFMNERLWGTLNASWMIPPALAAAPDHDQALELAIASLRYGTVAVNQWPALGYAWAGPPWGGHPSATLADAQSGLGWVHNAHLLEGVEKVVLRGPLPAWPKPIWFADHRGAAEAGRQLVDYEAQASWWRAARVAVPAVLG
ncbi:MAG: aldehyde dehydrogenase family protein [Myxococcota bacterium]